MTQDSKVLMGSQEAEASQETLDLWGPQACPLEMKIQREAFQGRWDPKVSQENQDPQHAILAHQELMENRVPKDSPGPQAHLDQMASCSA